MNEKTQRLMQELRSGRLDNDTIERMEAELLRDFRAVTDTVELADMARVLAQHGTILAVPTLAAMCRTYRQSDLYQVLRGAIALIGERARVRGSLLPDEYFTLAHWQPRWEADEHRFLSYVAVVANYHQTDDEDEMDRVGMILAEEMNIAITPYESFRDYRICQTSWDFNYDLHIVMDHIEQEQVMAELENTGVSESISTFLLDHLKDLQYSYLATRLGFAEDFDFGVYRLKIAECLNVEDE